MPPEPALHAPHGTEDLLPETVPFWRRLEEAVRRVCELHGYEEVRTPVFEHAPLFVKGTGETTEIVEKQMYTFQGGDETFALRPEFTPSIVRALIQHHLYRQKGLWKFFYFGPAFRHERPQKGRCRQFHQFGVEALGSPDPRLDAETVLVLRSVLEEAGVRTFEVRLNSLGCARCRGGYRDALRSAVAPKLESHCGNCRRRFERNVFRLLDCKAAPCVAVRPGYPKVVDHICGECRDHFEAVGRHLHDVGAEFRVDPWIVRGLDYYTRTVYEFSSAALGAQDALGGGGRYDTLVAEMGGPEMGAVGFSAGMERVVIAMGAAGATGRASAPDFYVVCVGPEQRAEAFRLATQLRRAGLRGDLDFEGRSVKAQMRSADRGGARWTLLMGEQEAKEGKVRVKEMATGEEILASGPETERLMKERRA